MPETTILMKNIQKLMFIYSLNRGEMKKLFGRNFFLVISDSTHKKHETTLRKLCDYFNLTMDHLVCKEIVNTDLNQRYFL